MSVEWSPLVSFFFLFFFLSLFISPPISTDALQSVEELEQEIQRTSDELKEQLEDVEYSMIEIDDILAELKGVHGSRAFFKTTTKEFKESLDELGDPDSEKRGVLGQKIQYLRDEIKRNDGLKKEVEGKIREEKSGLALLLERIQMLQVFPFFCSFQAKNSI